MCGKQNVIVLGKSEELGQKNEFDCEELCDFNGMVDILCHWSGKICNPADWIWLNWTDSNCLSCEKSNKVNAMRTAWAILIMDDEKYDFDDFYDESEYGYDWYFSGQKCFMIMMIYEQYMIWSWWFLWSIWIGLWRYIYSWSLDHDHDDIWPILFMTNMMTFMIMINDNIFTGMSPAPATARAGRSTPSQVPRWSIQNHCWLTGY